MKIVISINYLKLREMVHEYLGEYIENVIISYFRSLISEEKEDLVYVFMSRKGFCLYELMVSCQYIKERPDVKVISDRYLYKITDWSDFADKRFFVIDDTVSLGAQMNKICGLLKSNGVTNITPCAVFVSTSFDNSIGLPEGINCADVVSMEQIHDYTYRVMKLINATATPFTMDLPVYWAVLNGKQLNSLREFPKTCTGETWEGVDMHINIPDDGDVETNFAFRYLRPNAGLNFLFEGMRVTYCMYEEEDSFIVRLIPVTIFDKVDLKTALEFLLEIINQYTHVYGNELKELSKLLADFNSTDLTQITRLHKILSYVLALRISQRFFAEYNVSEFKFDKEYESYHFPAALAKELEILRRINISELIIPFARTLDDDMPPQDMCEKNAAFSEAEVYEAAENILRTELYQDKPVVTPSCGEGQSRDKPAISLYSLREVLFKRFKLAKESSAAAGLASLCSTLLSGSSYTAKIVGTDLCKYAYSGENSFYAIRCVLPYYWGLYSYALTFDDYDEFKENIDSFTEAFQAKFPISKSKDEFLEKVKSWAKGSESLRTIASLWPYMTSMDYDQFCEELESCPQDDSQLSLFAKIQEWVFSRVI